MKILWLYARLLRLYPREFYERFNAEMLDVFTQAWQDQPQGRTATWVFSLHKLGGLLLSIATEHGQANGRVGLRRLFRRRFVPLWLFVFSLIPAALLSQSYWGYVTVPASTISAVSSIDQIALVRFDADYIPSVIPLNDIPTSIISDFPPSQILSAVPTHLDMDQALDPTLIARLSEALAGEGVELGVIIEQPREPVINPNGCGATCFQSGVQFQADGSLLITFPGMAVEGQQRVESFTERVSPNDRWYYDFIIPAGYVVQGRDANGSQIVFTAMAGRVGGDHYRYHELTFAQEGDGLTLHNRQSYNFDIAGIEGVNLPVITMLLFVPLLCLWGVILLFRSLIKSTGRRVKRWRSVA